METYLDNISLLEYSWKIRHAILVYVFLLFLCLFFEYFYENTTGLNNNLGSEPTLSWWYLLRCKWISINLNSCSICGQIKHVTVASEFNSLQEARSYNSIKYGAIKSNWLNDSLTRQCVITSLKCVLGVKFKELKWHWPFTDKKVTALLFYAVRHIWEILLN